MKIVRTFAFRSSGVAVWIAEREDAKVALTLDYAHRLVVGIQRFMGISSPFFLWFGKAIHTGFRVREASAEDAS